MTVPAFSCRIGYRRALIQSSRPNQQMLPFALQSHLIIFTENSNGFYALMVLSRSIIYYMTSKHRTDPCSQRFSQPQETVSSRYLNQEASKLLTKVVRNIARTPPSLTFICRAIQFWTLLCCRPFDTRLSRRLKHSSLHLSAAV